MFVSGGTEAVRTTGDTEEARLRWATGEDYEVISRLGSGTFGSVWKVRDLTLSRVLVSRDANFPWCSLQRRHSLYRPAIKWPGQGAASGSMKSCPFGQID